MNAGDTQALPEKRYFFISASEVAFILSENEELGWGKRVERHFVQQSMQIICIDKQNR